LLRDGREGAKGKRGNYPSKSQNFEFVSKEMAPELKSNQTFPIILPNIIHQNKEKGTVPLHV